MAITGPVPVVADAAWYTRTTNGTAWDLPMPAVCGPNDIVLALFMHDGDIQPMATIPAGWVRITGTNGGANAIQSYAYLCNGNEGGTTASFVSTLQEQGVVRILRITGARPDLTAIEYASSSGTSAAPDPPALTPGAGSDQWLWLAAVCADTAVGNTSYPANMPDYRATAVSSAGNADAVRGQVSGWAAGGDRATLDPSAAAIGSSQAWRGRTHAIRPGIPPVASFTSSLDPADPDRNTVKFVGTATERAYAWHWDFGDGNTSTLQSPTHDYGEPGQWLVTFKADNHVGTGSAPFRYVETLGPPGDAHGRPELLLTIDGLWATQTCSSAEFANGRQTWFDDLEPASATFTFVGKADVSINAKVVATTEGDRRPLWTGYVTDVRQDNDPNDVWRTTVSCTDALGRLGWGVDRDANVPPGNLITQADFVLKTMGFPGVTVSEVATVGTLVPLLGAKIKENLLQYLGLAERASNALLVMRADGNMKIMVRAASSPGTVTGIPLVGDDSPGSWVQTMAGAELINSFAITYRDVVGPEKGYYAWRDGTGGATPTGSIGQYGLQTYVVDDAPMNRGTTYPAEPTPAPWPLAMRSVVAHPRFVLEEATFHIVDHVQAVLWLQPLDRVVYEGVNWQVLSVSHRIDPWQWDMSITADQTQDIISGGADPVTDPPPDPTVTPVTLTYNAPTKDTQIVRSPSGVESGSGKGENLAVGYWQGYRYKTLLDFGLIFPDGTKRVTKATLYLTTSTQVQVGFGSSPQLIVRRVIESWAEGTAVGNNTGNATVWPGPDTVTDAQVTKAIPTGQGVEVGIDVTNLVEAMRKTGHRFGFRLHSSNEDSSSRTTEFRSKEFGNVGLDARLVVKVEVAV